MKKHEKLHFNQKRQSFKKEHDHLNAKNYYEYYINSK